MEYILQADDITKFYGDFPALQNVSINIPEKSIFGLLGPNGAGKTTLIRIITQILMPDKGTIWFRQQQLKSKDIRQMGYLPEERGLYKKMKVGEHLVYLAMLKGLNKAESVQRVKYWLKRFELNEWTDKKVEDLSKGMQQKVQFIATILHEPSLIILDEPFSGFDPINVGMIKDEILELQDKGATLIFSTHRMETVEELCDHIALINKSRKILDGKKQDIKDEFKTNTFAVEHKNPISRMNHGYEILHSDQLSENYYRTIIKILDEGDPNSLIALLIDKVDVNSFLEVVPDINEIFIKKVKSVTDE
ncbi:ABC transporter ATP-binding protein [Bacteroidota bacterium]